MMFPATIVAFAPMEVPLLMIALQTVLHGILLYTP